MIKAIIFDIDGVLLDSLEANHRFFSDLMVHFNYKAPSKKEYEKIFHLTMFNVIKTLTNLSDEDKIKEIWEAARNRTVTYPNDLLKTPEGAEDVIKKVSEKYQLGIVTSRIREGLDEAPQLQPLLKYFGSIITVYDTNKHKPDPEPLLLCAKQLKIDPEECVYVGDVENDAIAARSANMKIVGYGEKIKDANAKTNTFKDLPKIIEKLSKN